MPHTSADAASSGIFPAWLANRFNVSSAERSLLNRDGPLYPTDPAAVVAGGSALNADGSTTRTAGVWLEAAPFELDALPAAVAQPRVHTAAEAANWRGYSGPLRVRVRFARRPAGTSEPLVVTGVTGASDFIFVRYLADGRIAIGHDHWGEGGALSEPFNAVDDAEHEIIVSLGSLFPSDDTAACYGANPLWRQIRRERIVLFDGKSC